MIAVSRRPIFGQRDIEFRRLESAVTDHACDGRHTQHESYRHSTMRSVCEELDHEVGSHILDGFDSLWMFPGQDTSVADGS